MVDPIYVKKQTSTQKAAAASNYGLDRLSIIRAGFGGFTATRHAKGAFPAAMFWIASNSWTRRGFLGMFLRLEGTLFTLLRISIRSVKGN